MPTAAVVGATVVSAGLQVAGQREQRKAQRRAQRRQRAAEAAENRRQTIQSLQQERIQRSRVIAASAASDGGLQSSAVQGGLGSLGSQTSSNRAFANQINELNAQQSQILQGGADRAATFGAIGSLLSTGAQVGSQSNNSPSFDNPFRGRSTQSVSSSLQRGAGLVPNGA